MAFGHMVFWHGLLSNLLCCPGISEPLPVAATFYMPDALGTTMEGYAHIDTMVCFTCVLAVSHDFVKHLDKHMSAS